MLVTMEVRRIKMEEVNINNQILLGFDGHVFYLFDLEGEECVTIQLSELMRAKAA